jgi:starch synthase (maltosyl-transferring)
LKSVTNVKRRNAMKKKERMIIYNMFPLLAGKVKDWENHLVRASEMGFNWIFVNPIQLPGMSGSLYSIKDYFRISPLFIDEKSKKPPEEQIQEMTRIAGKLGLKMMVDLVISHCAIDSDLIKEHREWFQWEGEGQVAHPFCDENGHKVVWGDLAKFDHRHTRDREGLYQYCSKIVEFLINLGFKGFRCDAAYQIPGSLWNRLIRETKDKHRDVLFFAETLGCTADQTRKTAMSGFDYIFNSVKWWDFHGYWLLENYNLTREIAPSIGFPESHDTVRLCEELHGHIEGLKQRYLFSALFSSGSMMTMGFEYGFRRKPHVVHTRPEDWEETDIDLAPFIEKVNRIKEKYTIFQEDAPTEIFNTSNPNVLIMWKASTTTQDESLLILNKDIYNRQQFYADNLRQFVQAGAPLKDVSPEYVLDYIPEPFSYDLRPGQGIVLVTTREAAEEGAN